MDSHNDPMQEAADEGGGVEGKTLKHNCKAGQTLLDGAAIGAIIRVVFFMDLATHGWVQFSDDQRSVVHSDIRRFAVVKPDRNEQVPSGYKPNTSCLCIIESTGQLATYQSASWSARIAFTQQLIKPYTRARKAGILPVVTLGFKEGRDDNGNYLPDFNIVDLGSARSIRNGPRRGRAAARNRCANVNTHDRSRPAHGRSSRCAASPPVAADGCDERQAEGAGGYGDRIHRDAGSRS
jgi:hypothetical protein